ncbi:MAG: SDR family NAD(P)-dependent oxidoreductase [Dehalogenimonas sp.]|uniref:SDR family NAD(P)-dependent oxidoreductase n=1 Tax=Candidatus Dehalogenimonas loeffleri TaxID=3127115 RepID=A0ABZ2J0U5_9CHLR|nr:SDR family NAD(P)-dependent oxidoreductase [Dehalogenimonas sp.]
MIIENAGLDPESLGGNVAVVTNAGQGLGRETAVSLAFIGASVAVVDADAAAGAETVRVIEKAGGRAIFFQSEAFSQEQMARLYQMVLKSFGKIDLLAIDDRCLGAMEFLPGMLERRYGVIAIVGSELPAVIVKEELVKQLDADGRVAVFTFDPGGEGNAELAGAGLVGALRFGRVFHGKAVDWVTGLAKLGLDAQGQQVPAEETVELSGPPAGTPGAIAQALAEVMAEIEVEYERLSILVRQVAKRMFLQGTGLKVDEWRVYAFEMSQVLTDGVVDEVLTGDYLEKLGHLRDFLAAQEVEAQNWVKSDEDLISVVESLAFRRQVVNDLMSALRLL